MNPHRFLSILKDRFEGQRIDLLNEERGLRVQIADALLDAKLKAFTEYPYKGSKGLCDIAITRKRNYRSVTDWIELKPILNGWNYWNRSKFLGEQPFFKDIEKLRQVKAGAAWFLVVMQWDAEMFDNGAGTKPVKGKRLSPGQIRSQIDDWAESAPTVLKPFKVTDGYCHVFLWKVHHQE